MKKNFTVNISGLLFHIDEDAYEALNQYFNRLRSHFAGTPGRDEIIADIEGRIAEMLQERSAGNGGIVSYDIVKEVTGLMGDPTEFVDDGTESGNDGSNEPKRIFRDPEDKILGGVCGGLGAYFNVDPLWFRIGFAVLTLIGGSGILIYAVLWIAVPAARTPTDRLRMRGEKVNISNIERTLKDEFNGIRDTFRDINYPGKKKPGQRTDRTELYRQLNNGIGAVLRFFASVFGGILLVLGILTGIALILLTQIGDGRVFGGFVPAKDLSALMDWVSLSGHDAGLLAISLAIIVFTPIAIILYTGLRLLFGTQVRIPSAYSVLFSILVIASAVMAFLMIRITNDIHEDHSEKAVEERLIAGADRSLIIRIAESDLASLRQDDTYRYFLFDEEARLPVSHNGDTFKGMAELEVRPSRDSLITVQVIREALGADHREALRNISEIPYVLQSDTGECVISGTFLIQSEFGWRNQRLRYILRLPESNSIMLDKTAARILTDPENIQPNTPLKLENVGGKIRTVGAPTANAGTTAGGHTLEML